MPKNPEDNRERFEPIYFTLGKRLRWLRNQKNLSTDALGRQIGVTGGAVAGFETGKVKVKVHDLVRIAEVYGAEITEFIGLVLSGIDPKEAHTPEVVRQGRKAMASRRLATLARKATAKKRKGSK